MLGWDGSFSEVIMFLVMLGRLDCTTMYGFVLAECFLYLLALKPKGLV